MAADLGRIDAVIGGVQLVGRWRIVEADIWDRSHLDLRRPAMIVIRANGRGEIAFGALEAALDIEYGRSSIDFTWNSADEMDQVESDGSAELLGGGSLEIEFAYRNGDEAVLKTKWDTFSTACHEKTRRLRHPFQAE